ncbi:SDR family oxidoreductase [Gluconobacter morbifer]|uniref:Short chain dehydrogenase n=1 Tax=Gluconobacter morbifer G707 TaxID=1088869 RepID=G6XF60_9PROT|nr:SDR family oxidoreductase [Gluconobacter morbifer]EHH68818.1 short chain dehydrogenase [Gluconobacter morbifer G707]
MPAPDLSFGISSAVPRVALVTGGGRRLGAALVRMLAQQGFAVAIHYHGSEAEAEALLTEIGGRGCILQADLACEAAVETLLSRAMAALGPVGVLINNASAFERDEIGDATRESWDRHLEPNLRAPFVLSQTLARELPENAQGLILNMLDQRVWNLTPHFVSYTISKSALWTLTQTLALALAPRIRVNAIGPGPVLPAPRQAQAHFDLMCARTPLGHGSSPDEIACAALALFSLPSVTGQMLALDAGQHLNWSPAS